MSGVRYFACLVAACMLWVACTCEPVLRPDELFSCGDDTHCATGFVCLEGLCHPDGTKLDAGTDGGDCFESALACDAGSDAGLPDGGIDAGPLDSGTDAGFDAGIPDAGPAWQSADIGAFFKAGTVSYSGGVITAEVQNGDIWYGADDFFYLYQTRSGDIEVTALVAGIDAGALYAKTGVMIRQNLTPGSPNAFVAITAFRGNSFQVRDGGGQSTGPGTVGLEMERAPYWVRLVRQSGTVRGYVSPDGGTFTQIGVLPDPFTNSVYVGLAIASHDLDAGNVSVFSDVTIRVP